MRRDHTSNIPVELSARCLLSSAVLIRSVYHLQKQGQRNRQRQKDIEALEGQSIRLKEDYKHRESDRPGASIWFENWVCRGSWFENWDPVGPKNVTDQGTWHGFECRSIILGDFYLIMYKSFYF